MAIQIACPKCNSTYNVAEAALGKMVKCQNCQSTFAAKAMAGQVAAGSKQGAGGRTSATKQPAALALRPNGNRVPPNSVKPTSGQPAAANGQDLARFGVDGPIAPPPNLFTAAQPLNAGPDPLANHVVQGLNFVPVDQKKIAAARAKEAEASNPFAIPKKADDKHSSGHGVVKTKKGEAANSNIEQDRYIAKWYSHLLRSIWVSLIGTFVVLPIVLIVPFVFFVRSETAEQGLESFSAASTVMLTINGIFSVIGAYFGILGLIASWNLTEKLRPDKVNLYLMLTLFVPVAYLVIVYVLAMDARKYLRERNAKFGWTGAKV